MAVWEARPPDFVAPVGGCAPDVGTWDVGGLNLSHHTLNPKLKTDRSNRELAECVLMMIDAVCAPALSRLSAAVHLTMGRGTWEVYKSFYSCIYIDR